jgi:hypothetical protein
VGQGLDQVLRQLLGQVSQHVRGVVRGHLLDHLGQLLVLEVLGEIVAQVVGELLHQVGGLCDGESAEDLGPESPVEDLEEQCQVRGVQQRQKPVEGPDITALDQRLQVVHLWRLVSHLVRQPAILLVSERLLLIQALGCLLVHRTSLQLTDTTLPYTQTRINLP